VVPLVMFGIFLVVFTVYSFKSNHWLVRTLVRVITAPLTKVEFRDFFLGDQLVSLAISLMDLEFLICYYTNDALSNGSYCENISEWVRPMIALLPQWWRVMQVCMCAVCTLC
jgi:hypothetical protein